MQRLPGGPDESARIQVVSNEITAAEEQAAGLETQMTLRPAVSQYHQLSAEIAAFISRSCNSEQCNKLLLSLQVSLFPCA